LFLDYNSRNLTPQKIQGKHRGIGIPSMKHSEIGYAEKIFAYFSFPVVITRFDVVSSRELKAKTSGNFRKGKEAKKGHGEFLHLGSACRE